MNDIPADGPREGSPAEERFNLPDTDQTASPEVATEPELDRRRWKRVAVVVAGAAVAAAGLVLAAFIAKREADDAEVSTTRTGYDEDDVCEDYDDDEDYDDEQSLSVSDASDIWLSNGMDEDYTFGYSDAELRRAAGSD